jgi:hypothetical protein
VATPENLPIPVKACVAAASADIASRPRALLDALIEAAGGDVVSRRSFTDDCNRDGAPGEASSGRRDGDDEIGGSEENRFHTAAAPTVAALNSPATSTSISGQPKQSARIAIA